MTIAQINDIIKVLLGSGLAALITALFLGRKTRAEAQNLDAKTIGEYQTTLANLLGMVTDLQTKDETRENDNKALRADNKALHDELEKLRDEVAQSNKEKDDTIARLSMENAKFKIEVESLRNRVRELEKQLPPESGTISATKE